MRLYYLKGRRPDRDLFQACRERNTTVTPLWVNPLSILRAWPALRRKYPQVRVGLGNARDALGVAQYVREARPMMLFSALPRANTAVVIGTELASPVVPTVVSVHTVVSIGYSEKQLSRARILHPRSNAVVAVSQGVREEVIRTLGINGESVYCIDNGISPSEIRRLSQEEVNHPWFCDDPVPVILTVGRPSREKDHLTLVEAFGRVRRQLRVRLVIMGNRLESYQTRLRSMAGSLGVEQDFGFLDFDENPFRYMRRARLVVLSSRSEAFPTVLMEAMACGTSVISTNAPHGPAEILGGGRWGKLVPVGDPPALAQAILDVLGGDAIAETELRLRADDFADHHAARAYEDLFEKVVNSVSIVRSDP